MVRKMANVIGKSVNAYTYVGHGNMDEEYKMGDAVLGRITRKGLTGDLSCIRRNS